MGYSVVTTVLSAAASYDLTDITTVKTELGIKTTDTSNDGWLTDQAIPEVSKAIARHCKRVFPPELLQNAFDIQQDPYPYQTPGGFAQLELTRYPVLDVVSVIQTLAPANNSVSPPIAAVTVTLNANVDFRLDPATGQLLRLNPFTGVGVLWEALPVTVIFAAGYGVLVSGETHSVPGTPFQVTVSGSASFSCDQSVSYASGAALTRVAASPAQGQYTVAAGVYTFNSADAGQLLTFVYATVAIPDDLAGIALRLVSARFWGRKRGDPALIQQDQPGMGTQRWWFGGAPGQRGPFPPDIEAELDNYRQAVVL